MCMVAETSMCDVVVIGAGLSGLVAARRLVQAGMTSVRVLEAQDRVGGRTKGHQLENGRRIELGGQLIGPEYKRLIALGEELGVSSWPHYQQGDTLFERRGQVVQFGGSMPWKSDALGSADFTRSLMRLDHLCKRTPLGLEGPEATRLDSRTFASWVATATRTSTARIMWSIIATLTLGGPPGELSLYNVARHLRLIGGVEALLASLSGGQERSFEGGSVELCLRMAEELGDVVVLGSPTVAIRQHGDHVEIQCAAQIHHARRVVIALSPPDRAGIHVEPQLPLPHRTMNERMSMLHMSKVHVVYPTPFWRDRGCSGASMSDSSPLMLTFDDTPPDAVQGTLVGFARGDGASWAHLPDAMPRDVAKRRDAVLSGLARVFGDQALEPDEYYEMNWADEERMAGCVPIHGPGLLTNAGPGYAEPAGRLHIAGSESSLMWTGSMEGAVLAGERAATEILARY